MGSKAFKERFAMVQIGDTFTVEGNKVPKAVKIQEQAGINYFGTLNGNGLYRNRINALNNVDRNYKDNSKAIKAAMEKFKGGVGDFKLIIKNNNK